jgi:hypothetical protein
MKERINVLFLVKALLWIAIYLISILSFCLPAGAIEINDLYSVVSYIETPGNHKTAFYKGKKYQLYLKSTNSNEFLPYRNIYSGT